MTKLLRALPTALGLAAAALLLILLALLPNPALLRVPVGALVVGAAVGMLVARRQALHVLVAAAALTLLLWAGLRPRLDRDWDPTQAVLPRAKADERGFTFEGVRSFRWTEDGHHPGYRSLRCDFDALGDLELVVSRFADHDAVAHTMFSLRCGGERLLVSPEIRRQRGEDYSVWRGLLRNYELMYVLADERDALHLRTHVRKERVFLLPVATTPAQRRALLLRVAERVEGLAAKPAFYNTATASCATSLAADAQVVADGALELDWRVLLPGFSGEMAWDLGLLDRGGETSWEAFSAAHRAHADAADEPERYSGAVRGR